MSVPSSVEELLQLIRKSGMVDEPKLAAYLARRHAGRGLPDDPRDAADAMVADGILTNFQSEQFLLGKWRGFTIGKYKLLERVGVGGMGQVFLCEHRAMRRRVAIKVLPPAKAEQPAALGRFYREARAAGVLDHPHIVRTHDIDQDGNLHFIVMEYVDGSNLLDIVKRFGPMEVGRASHYVKQVAGGLEFAFANGLIHRDVKPGNILIDRAGTAKVLDLGLARFTNDQTDNLTMMYDDKVVLGTADYVAPEQVANSHAVDVRADVYALGATLYFMLAGHPPFPSGTVSQKLLWHRTKEPTPIRQVRPEVPDGLAAVVTKMMAKDPAGRYQTPAAVAAALAPFVPAAVPPPPAEEMPALSPAATEDAPAELVAVGAPAGTGTFAAAPAAGGTGTFSPLSVTDIHARPAGPFAPPPGASRVNMQASPLSARLPTRQNTQVGPFRPPSGQSEIPTRATAQADPTPTSAPRPVFDPPPAGPGAGRKVAALAAAAAVTLGLAFACYKLFA